MYSKTVRILIQKQFCQLYLSVAIYDMTTDVAAKMTGRTSRTQVKDRYRVKSEWKKRYGITWQQLRMGLSGKELETGVQLTPLLIRRFQLPLVVIICFSRVNRFSLINGTLKHDGDKAWPFVYPHYKIILKDRTPHSSIQKLTAFCMYKTSGVSDNEDAVISVDQSRTASKGYDYDYLLIIFCLLICNGPVPFFSFVWLCALMDKQLIGWLNLLNVFRIKR